MRTGEGVDGNIGGLAAEHPTDLRFLEIGDDIDPGSHWHDGHQLCAGLDVKANSRSAIADRPIDRCFDHGVSKIEAGLVENCAIVQQRRLRFRALRPEYLDLLLGRGEDCLIVFNVAVFSRRWAAAC